MNDDHRHGPPQPPPQQPHAAQPQSRQPHSPQPQWNGPQSPQGHWSATPGPHVGASPHPHAQWNAPPSPHVGAQHAQPPIHQNAQAVHATGLGGDVGQAYLAMFTRRPLPKARFVGLGAMGLACLVGMAQLAMIVLGGVYTWEGMALMFCAGVPGAWLAAMGDPPDPSTGLVSRGHRAGLIASFAIGLVLAFATSTFLVWVVGIEHW